MPERIIQIVQETLDGLTRSVDAGEPIATIPILPLPILRGRFCLADFVELDESPLRGLASL